jgi:hypothetical protein
MRHLALRLLPRAPEIGRDRAIKALIAGLPKSAPSRVARMAARLALFSVPVTAFAILLVRSGRVELAPALTALAAGLLLAAAAFGSGIAALVEIWQRGTYGADQAFAGIALGTLVLALPVAGGALALYLPPLHDITTDGQNPPQFTAAAARRTIGENLATYPGQASLALQAQAYPDIAPLTVDFPPEDVYPAALALIAEKGWTVLDPGIPPPRDTVVPSTTQIVARSSSLVLGLPQDVALRVRPQGEGSRIDMRSASRIGAHDLGWNAWRVQTFLRDLGTRMAGPTSAAEE